MPVSTSFTLLVRASIIKKKQKDTFPPTAATAATTSKRLLFITLAPAVKAARIMERKA